MMPPIASDDSSRNIDRTRHLQCRPVKPQPRFHLHRWYRVRHPGGAVVAIRRRGEGAGDIAAAIIFESGLFTGIRAVKVVTET